jgi:hypothetical protein
MLMLLHAFTRMPNLLPTAARTLFACRFCYHFPLPPPSAAAHTHAACYSTHTGCFLLHDTASTTAAPASTATSATAGATFIDSLKKVSIHVCD